MGFGDFDVRVLLGGVDRVMDARSLAAKLGTLDRIDRSKQYEGATEIEYRRSVNEAWSRIRQLQKELAKRDLVISELQSKLKSRNYTIIVLTSIITGVCWEAVKFLFVYYLGLR